MSNRIEWKPCATTAPENSGKYLFAVTTGNGSKKHVLSVFLLDYSTKHADYHGDKIHGWNRSDRCTADLEVKSVFAKDNDVIRNYWAEMPEFVEAEQ